MAVGYEFTKKDIRKEFSKTEFGKKVNVLYYVFLSAAAITVVCTAMIIVIKQLSGGELVDLALRINILPFMLAIYFDGKRDGAIAQFEAQKKSNK